MLLFVFQIVSSNLFIIRYIDVSGKLSANSHYSITELLFLYTAISIRTTATGIVYCKGYIHCKIKKNILVISVFSLISILHFIILYIYFSDINCTVFSEICSQMACILNHSHSSLKCFLLKIEPFCMYV